MSDLHATITQHIVRRLEDAYSFSGQLKCSFDASMPLNVTDLTQPFLMTCKSPPSKGTPGWVVTLIILGSIFGPFILMALIYLLVASIRCCRKAYKASRKRKQLAAERAAKNDFILESLPTPNSDFSS